jgi:MoxR-like ATPase
MPIPEVAERGRRILDEVERAVIGKRDALELVLLGLLADGHVLIEDYPGLAKTLAARSSTREFHAPHSAQRPIHLGAWAPHSWQAKTVFGGLIQS